MASSTCPLSYSAGRWNVCSYHLEDCQFLVELSTNHSAWFRRSGQKKAPIASWFYLTFPQWSGIPFTTVLSCSHSFVHILFSVWSNLSPTYQNCTSDAISFVETFSTSDRMDENHPSLEFPIGLEICMSYFIWSKAILYMISILSDVLRFVSWPSIIYCGLNNVFSTVVGWS